MKKLFLATMITCGAIALLVACSKKDDNAMPAGSALYQRLGSNAGIAKVIDGFIGNVVGDTVINKFFARTAQSQERVDRLKMNLVNQVAQAVGGPEKYTGLSMKAAHVGMGINNKQFDALVGDMVASLKSNGVSDADIATIGGALTPMRADIVEKP
ncbi:MAG: group 1 truncated hemoglobin [Filimonas sp.]|nr:group 1 truncated hemoglobin [Filimonas sp.]